MNIFQGHLTCMNFFSFHFLLGVFFFNSPPPPPISFLMIRPLVRSGMTGMLLNVGHLQVHKNISQGSLTGF